MVGGVISAQDLAADLKQVEKAHGADVLKVYQVDYKSFESHKSEEYLENEKALYIRKGAYQFYMENEAVISVYDHGKTLLIDREEKKMMLLHQPNIVARPDDLPIDSLLKMCSEVKFISEQGNKRTYHMMFDMEFFEYQSIQVTLNTQSWDIKALTLFYNTPMPIYDNGQVVEWTLPRLEVNYTTIPPTAQHKNLLAVENYIRTEGSRLLPVKAYQSYELVDHSQTP